MINHQILKIKKKKTTPAPTRLLEFTCELVQYKEYSSEGKR